MGIMTLNRIGWVSLDLVTCRLQFLSLMQLTAHQQAAAAEKWAGLGLTSVRLYQAKCLFSCSTCLSDG